MLIDEPREYELSLGLDDLCPAGKLARNLDLISDPLDFSIDHQKIFVPQVLRSIKMTPPDERYHLRDLLPHPQRKGGRNALLL
jgi:hypothetical protein